LTKIKNKKLAIQIQKKSTKPKSNLVSIVTVVFNGDKHLEKTIKSVINQNYSNIEFIVIDGGSTDQSLSIIKRYDHAIDQWLSEKDLGIYDAMNKGIAMAHGQWISFMNCGDYFYSKNTLYSIFDKNKLNDADVIYGNHQVIYPSKVAIHFKAGSIKNIWRGSQFSHQACFTRTYLLKKYKFNLDFKFSSDFDFFYKLWQKKYKFRHLNIIVASVLAGGVSDRHRIEVIGEWRKIVKKNWLTFFYYTLQILKENIKYLIKKRMNVNGL
jgi:glycosyltransferase involved in cell wall biosynthesis